MNYEEKYNDLLSRIKRMTDVQPDVTRVAIESLFPELKESEDKRIRKELIFYLRYQHSISKNFKDIGKWIAWLEKQDKNNMSISEDTKQELEDNLNEALEKETPESWNEFLDKKGEQKPVELQQNMLSQEKYEKAVDECIYGEQNPTWSKEDEYVIETLFCLLHNEQDKYPQQSSEFQKLEEIENKLKSFKDRVQPKQEWKPSEEEMVALEHAINCYSGISPTNTNEVFILEIMKERLKNLMK